MILRDDGLIGIETNYDYLYQSHLYGIINDQCNHPSLVINYKLYPTNHNQTNLNFLTDQNPQLNEDEEDEPSKNDNLINKKAPVENWIYSPDFMD